MRSCTGCGAKKEKTELVRVIRTPEGEIRLDITGRANGRGAYLCKDPACLAKARKKRALERSLGGNIPDEVYGMLEEELKKCSPGGGDAG